LLLSRQSDVKRKSGGGVIANQTFFRSLAGASHSFVIVIRFLADNRVKAAFAARNSVTSEAVELDARAKFASFGDCRFQLVDAFQDEHCF
jgi:hypothetical protein